VSGDVMAPAPLVQHFDLIAQAPGGVARLRELILTLAVQGKLVPQDPSDETASELLKKIRSEKDRLIAEGKIKRDKPLAEIADAEKPFELPHGWKWVRLGQIALQVTDGTHHTPKYQSNGVAFISVKDIDGKTVSFDDCKFITEQEHVQINSRCNPERGDILLCRIGTLGRPTLVDTDRAFSLFVSVGLIKLPKACSIGQFIHLVMKSPLLTNQYQLIKAGGSHTNKLNLGDIPQLLIPIPSEAEQSRIVTRVEELMQVCDALEASGQLEAQQHAQLVNTLLGKLTQSETPEVLADNWQRIATHFDLLLDRPEAVDALEQTILQLAVRGLLVPQDPTDEPASVLLQKIRTEKDHLITQGKIKRDKPLPPITDEEKPFELPKGWEWARLQQAYDVRDGTHDTPKYQATGYPLVTSKNIYGGVLDLSDVKLISAEDHEQISARSKVDRNDILFAMIGSIGNPVLVDTDLEFSVKNVALFKYYAPPLSCPAYLLLLLQTEAKGIRERAAGAVQSFVSLGQLRSAVVALPSLAEQSRIVVRVNELRLLCADLRETIVTSCGVMENLSKALVSKA
jgi:type I restriction enzyme S subunit